MGGWGCMVGGMASDAWAWMNGQEMTVVPGHWSWSWEMISPWSLIRVHIGPGDLMPGS